MFSLADSGIPSWKEYDFSKKIFAYDGIIGLW